MLDINITHLNIH